MTLDERNRDGDSGITDSDTFDGARKVSRFGESVADLLAEIFVGRKEDVVTPSDVV